MNNTKYQSMSVDDLFATMEDAAVKSHDSFVSGASIEKSNEWIEIQNAAQEEIQRRGVDAVRRYIPLLKASHPAVRLAAALGAKNIALGEAVPVLEELRQGRYETNTAMNARMTLDGMRKRGLIPPSK